MENLTALDVFFYSSSVVMAGSVFYLMIRLRRAKFIIDLLVDANERIGNFAEATAEVSDDLYDRIDEINRQIDETKLYATNIQNYVELLEEQYFSNSELFDSEESGFRPCKGMTIPESDTTTKARQYPEMKKSADKER